MFAGNSTKRETIRWRLFSTRVGNCHYRDRRFRRLRAPVFVGRRDSVAEARVPAPGSPASPTSTGRHGPACPRVINRKNWSHCWIRRLISTSTPSSCRFARRPTPSILQSWNPGRNISPARWVSLPPYYDPLTFAIDEAHRRGLHLHVWFNPYRVQQSGAKSEPSPDHVSQTKPEIVRKYGPCLWFDPGEPER